MPPSRYSIRLVSNSPIINSVFYFFLDIQQRFPTIEQLSDFLINEHPNKISPSLFPEGPADEKNIAVEAKKQAVVENSVQHSLGMKLEGQMVKITNFFGSPPALGPRHNFPAFTSIKKPL